MGLFLLRIHFAGFPVLRHRYHLDPKSLIGNVLAHDFTDVVCKRSRKRCFRGDENSVIHRAIQRAWTPDTEYQ